MHLSLDQLPGHRVGVGAGARLPLDRLQLLVVEELQHLDLGQALVVLGGGVLARVPVALDVAVLLHEAVEAPVEQNLERRVALEKQVGEVVRLLLALLDVVGALGLEHHEVVGVAENADQAGEGAVDDVGDLRRDHLAESLLLVAVLLAQVVVVGERTLVIHVAGGYADRVLKLCVTYLRDLVVG